MKYTYGKILVIQISRTNTNAVKRIFLIPTYYGIYNEWANKLINLGKPEKISFHETWMIHCMYFITLCYTTRDNFIRLGSGNSFNELL